MSEEEIRKSRPRHCPNCGDTIRLTANNAAVLVDSSDERYLWDVYCRECEWSGNVSPEMSGEQDIHPLVDELIEHEDCTYDICSIKAEQMIRAYANSLRLAHALKEGR